VKKKFRIAKWSVVCRPKDQGGLESHDLRSRTKLSLVNGFLGFLSKIRYVNSPKKEIHRHECFVSS
jgi:hypothetical protein